MTIRYDSFPLGGLSRAKKDEFGFLHVPANVTRCGVFDYMRADGTVRREFKPPEEFHSKRFLSTIARAVVTDEHPRPLGTAVTPKNAKDLSRGQAGSDVRVAGNLVEADLNVTHDSLIKNIESGKQTEVSLGFKMRIDHVSGVWRGMDGKGPPQPYDVIQRDPVCNHIAVTRKARGGAEIRLRLDSDDAVMVSDSQEDETQERKNLMHTIIVDGISVQVENETAASIIRSALSKRDEKATTLETDSAGLRSQLDKLQAAKDQADADLKAKGEEFDKLKVDSIDPGRVSELVRVRTSLESDAGKLLDDKEMEGIDSMSDAEVRRLAVSKHTDLTCDSDPASADYRSDDYVTARFDALVEGAGEANHQRLGKVVALAGNSRTQTKNGHHNKLNQRIQDAMLTADSAWRSQEQSVVARKEA